MRCEKWLAERCEAHGARRFEAGSTKLIAFPFARGRMMSGEKWWPERCEAQGDDRSSGGAVHDSKLSRKEKARMAET